MDNMMENEMTVVKSEIESHISILRKMSELDVEIAKLKNNEAGIPYVIETVEGKCREAGEEVRTMEENIKELKKELRDKEGEAKGAQDHIGTKRSRLTDVKTNKEYAAILSEMELLEGQISENEERQLAVMEELEGLEVELKQKKANLEAEKRKFEEFKKQKEIEKIRIRETIEEETVKRGDVYSRLGPELAQQYDRLIESGKENAVVAYKSQACQMCFARTTPQEEVLMKRRKDIVSCPQCGRFLYWGE